MRVRDDCEEAPIALLNDFEKALREDKELADKFNSLSKELAAAGELSEYEVFAQAAGKLWDTYRAYLPQYFADGAPLILDLEGFFHCEKGSADYAIPYVHKDLPTDDLGRLPYCESLTHSIFIGPDGRTAPCMAFSNTVLGERFPSVLEEPLSQITKQGLYFDVSQATVGDLVDRNPACAECPHLMKCLGGCMVEDVTDDGDYLVPDSRCCHFFKHIGEQAVRDAADAAITAAGLW